MIRKPGLKTTLLGLVLLAVALIGVAWLCLPGLINEDEDDHIDDRVAVTEAAAAIRATLPLATNITFGKIKTIPMGDRAAVCGHVDIDEPNDAFDGPERFIYAEGELMIEETDGTDAVSQRWSDVCDAF